MYHLDRTRKVKIVLGILTAIFFVLFMIGFAGGGQELIFDGYMSDPLYAIVMVGAFFAAIICLIGIIFINALEKDVAEWLKIIDKRIVDNNM